MRSIGFSTGSLAMGDFHLGLKMIQGQPATAVELSALRDSELVPLIEALEDLDLSQFSYVSFHAPSRFDSLDEVEVVSWLQRVARRDWPIIVHPDVVRQFARWRDFGSLICVENMDKRKPAGRTVAELDQVFDVLPDASLCLDIGHARQVDPSMCEAELILRQHGHRLKQLHVSDVTSQSRHERLSLSAILAFQKIAPLIPDEIPLILETPVSREDLVGEINRARSALSHADRGRRVAVTA
jgi:hypothetical protein